MILKIYNKLKSFFPSNFKNHKAVDVDDSSILLPGCSLRFDVGMENRIYLKIGKKSLISCNFIFESKNGFIEIGDNVNIGGANLISREKITIGNDVTMAWGITIYDHDSHSIYWSEREFDNSRCYDDYRLHKNKVLNKNWDNVRCFSFERCYYRLRGSDSC
jgi:acetyltransferase-like isoleucine patch superfamily enzyme